MRKVLRGENRFAGAAFSSAGNQAQNLPGSVILSPCFEFGDLNCIVKGFWGGVPLNTETAAVNPRVGVAGPPRGVAHIPMPRLTRQCFDNLGSLADMRP
jgi:hypothetical protein